MARSLQLKRFEGLLLKDLWQHPIIQIGIRFERLEFNVALCAMVYILLRAPIMPLLL